MAMMQGSYTADGTVKYLEVPFDANWIKIVNMTTTIAGGAGSISEAYWQQGMDYGVGYTKLAADDSLASGNLAAATGIAKFNSGDNPLTGYNITATAITNADPPLVQLTDTTGLIDGDIVRFTDVVAAQQLSGIDFTIGALIANTSFTLPFMSALAIPATSGDFYKVKYDKQWYPRNRFISTITQAAQAVIEMTVAHDYAVGDYVRIMVPTKYGMTEMNLKEAKVTAIDATLNTITVNVDSTAFTAFAFPASTDLPLQQFAEVIPLSGPVTNIEVRGFEIQTGATAAGGVANDVIYWVAGDSFGI